MSGINLLPAVGHIQGVVLRKAGRPEDSICVLQYTDHNDKWHEIEIPVLDALYLLNLLSGMERDNGLHQRNREDRNMISGRVSKVGYSNKPNVKALDQEMALLMEDGKHSEAWQIILNMVDAVFVHDEIRTKAKMLGLKLVD